MLPPALQASGINQPGSYTVPLQWEHQIRREVDDQVRRSLYGHLHNVLGKIPVYVDTPNSTIALKEKSFSVTKETPLESLITEIRTCNSFSPQDQFIFYVERGPFTRRDFAPKHRGVFEELKNPQTPVQDIYATYKAEDHCLYITLDTPTEEPWYDSLLDRIANMNITPVDPPPPNWPSRFKATHAFDKRKALTTSIFATHPTWKINGPLQTNYLYIPVIVEQYPAATTIKKPRHLVETEGMDVAYFMATLKKKHAIMPEDELVMYVGRETLQALSSSMMEDIYRRHKDADGFLYVTITHTPKTSWLQCQLLNLIGYN